METRVVDRAWCQVETSKFFFLLIANAHNAVRRACASYRVSAQLGGSCMLVSMQYAVTSKGSPQHMHDAAHMLTQKHGSTTTNLQSQLGFSNPFYNNLIALSTIQARIVSPRHMQVLFIVSPYPPTRFTNVIIVSQDEEPRPGR
jgi:hypothetical protein